MLLRRSCRLSRCAARAACLAVNSLTAAKLAALSEKSTAQFQADTHCLYHMQGEIIIHGFTSISEHQRAALLRLMKRNSSWDCRQHRQSTARTCHIRHGGCSAPRYECAAE